MDLNVLDLIVQENKKLPADQEWSREEITGSIVLF